MEIEKRERSKYSVDGLEEGKVTCSVEKVIFTHKFGSLEVRLNEESLKYYLQYGIKQSLCDSVAASKDWSESEYKEVLKEKEETVFSGLSRKKSNKGKEKENVETALLLMDLLKKKKAGCLTDREAVVLLERFGI